MLLTDTPKNSTQVEDTSVDSHHNLQLSRIAPPHPYAEHEQADPGCIVDQEQHRDVVTTLEPEDMVLTSAAGPSNTSDSHEHLRCHCGKECTR